MTEDALLQPGLCIKPKVTQNEVPKILKDIYNLNCVSIKELNGYDDSNFWVKVDKDVNFCGEVCEDGYVLKIVNSLDSKKPELFEAQTQLLLHLNKQNICCPKPLQTNTGEYFTIQSFSSGDHIIRLLEFIPGKILHQVPTTPQLLYEAGQHVARIDDALNGFSHPAYDTHQTVWMLDSVPQLNQFLYVITDDNKKRLVESVINEFKNTILPVRHKLATGIIHGDFNEQNVLVQENGEGNGWQIKGVLDFGDCQYSCYLYEVAISMTYMMVQDKSLEAGGYVLQGYTSVRNITELEYSLLKVCIAARLCQSLVIGAYTSQQDPGNAYILTTSKPGWILLEQLWAQPSQHLLDHYWKVAK